MLRSSRFSQIGCLAAVPILIQVCALLFLAVKMNRFPQFPVPQTQIVKEVQSVYPILSLPVQVLKLSDDDGSNTCNMDLQTIQKLVDNTNGILSYAGVHLEFSQENIEDLKNTRVNHPFQGNDFGNSDFDEGQKVASQYPGKLVIFYRSRDRLNGDVTSFSGHNIDYVSMACCPTYFCQVDSNMAHEIGHYLGLDHTFAKSYASKEDAEEDLKVNSLDTDIFDGDGLADTFPDPYIIGNEEIDVLTSKITLDGIEMTLPFENLMSYYWGAYHLSHQQTEELRFVLSVRKEHQMTVPMNKNVQMLLAGDLLKSTVNKGTCHNKVPPDILFGESIFPQYRSCQLTTDSVVSIDITPTPATLPISRGLYDVYLYIYKGPDKGKFRVMIKNIPSEIVVDGYAPYPYFEGPILVATGIPLSYMQTDMTFNVLGKNDRSIGYDIGFDSVKFSYASYLPFFPIETPTAIVPTPTP